MNTETLRALASKATPGPYECVDGNSPHPDWLADIYCDHIPDGDYIAALDPATVLKLLDCVDALEDLVGEQNGPPTERRKDLWEEAMDKADAALDALTPPKEA